jgi:hypothetical protein
MQKGQVRRKDNFYSGSTGFESRLSCHFLHSLHVNITAVSRNVPRQLPRLSFPLHVIIILPSDPAINSISSCYIVIKYITTSRNGKCDIGSVSILSCNFTVFRKVLKMVSTCIVNTCCFVYEDSGMNRSGEPYLHINLGGWYAAYAGRHYKQKKRYLSYKHQYKVRARKAVRSVSSF